MAEKTHSPTDYMKENPFIALPLQAYKAKRNMLLCSVLCGFQAYYGGIGGTFSIFGNELNLPRTDFNVILFSLTVYFTSYFAMLGWATFLEWKLRSTSILDLHWGNDTKHVTAWGKIDEITKSTSDSKSNELGEVAQNQLTAFESDFWKHQRVCKRSFSIWEYNCPLFVSVLAALGLLVRIIFDVFLQCPAVN